MDVDSPLVFALRDLAGVSGAYSYGVPAADAVAWLRHNRHDGWVLHEVFGREVYRSPARVERLLADRKAPAVLDLGGNIGLYGLYVLRLFSAARLVSFEPDPENAALLRRCTESNDIPPERWALVEACASTSDGRVPFLAGLFGESHEATGAEMARAKTVVAVNVFPYLARADLVKIDIEGGEWSLLADPRFEKAAPPAIVLECHARNCPDPIPVRAARRALTRIGYEVREVNEARAPDNTLGMLWAWRE
jgi:FkbM family methyltransferase